MPTRNDIDKISTEYTASLSENITKNATGFESGNSLRTQKQVGMGVIVIKYFVYKFSNPDLAKAWYDASINEIKNTGGYKK